MVVSTFHGNKKTPLEAKPRVFKERRFQSLKGKSHIIMIAQQPFPVNGSKAPIQTNRVAIYGRLTTTHTGYNKNIFSWDFIFIKKNGTFIIK